MLDASNIKRHDIAVIMLSWRQTTITHSNIKSLYIVLEFNVSRMIFINKVLTAFIKYHRVDTCSGRLSVSESLISLVVIRH